MYIEQKELLEDPEKEKSRLEKQAQKLEKEVLKLAGRLKSKGFVDKAPEDVVLKARGELKEKKTSLMSTSSSNSNTGPTSHTRSQVVKMTSVIGSVHRSLSPTMRALSLLLTHLDSSEKANARPSPSLDD